MCYSTTVILVRKLIWDVWNIAHVARHHVDPDEVEAVCHGMPIILRSKQKRRLILIGLTAEERMLAVVLEAKGGGRYYTITAYDANADDSALYYRLRGGENNDKNEKSE